MQHRGRLFYDVGDTVGLISCDLTFDLDRSQFVSGGFLQVSLRSPSFDKLRTQGTQHHSAIAYLL